MILIQEVHLWILVQICICKLQLYFSNDDISVICSMFLHPLPSSVDSLKTFAARSWHFFSHFKKTNKTKNINAAVSFSYLNELYEATNISCICECNYWVYIIQSKNLYSVLMCINASKVFCRHILIFLSRWCEENMQSRTSLMDVVICMFPVMIVVASCFRVMLY